jgi:hypothetical protein
MTNSPKGTCLGESCPKFAQQLTDDIRDMGEHGAECNAFRTTDICAEVTGCVLGQTVELEAQNA